MFDSYRLLNEKIKKNIIFFPILLVIIFIFLLLLFNKITVPIYLEGTAILDYDTKSLLKISIPQNKLTILQNHNQIIISQKEYNYQIKKTEEDRLKNNIIVYLLIEKGEKVSIQNTIVNYKVKIDEINIFAYMRKK